VLPQLPRLVHRALSEREARPWRAELDAIRSRQRAQNRLLLAIIVLLAGAVAVLLFGALA
jgi:hypothetical protein